MMKNKHFVGRDHELKIFQDMLEHPNNSQHVLYVSGPGGIGKTLLLQQMLEIASSHPNTVVLDLIDLYSTENRRVEGLQETIIKLLEPQYSQFFQGPVTPPKFRESLISLCRHHLLVMGFDTFELIESAYVGGWILDQVNGLQVPGLICVIGGRRIPTTATSLLKVIDLPGFSVDQALSLYKERHPADTLDDLLGQFVSSLVEKTKGNPLFIELVFEWWRGFEEWSQDTIESLSQGEFEKELMDQLREQGDQGRIPAVDSRVSYSVYQTIICMAYLHRRLNQQILQRLIDEGFIIFHADEPGDIQKQKILQSLEKYFFVKVRPSGDLQLHDELRDLIRKYLWPYWESEETRRRFQEMTLELYDELIKEAKQL